MKKNIYTTPVVGIVKLDTTGIIATSTLGTGDRNDIEIKDEIFEGEFIPTGITGKDSGKAKPELYP